MKNLLKNIKIPILISKNVLQRYNADLAVSLYFLILKYQSQKKKWFVYTFEEQSKDTGLPITSINRIRVMMRKNKLIKTKIKGIPPIQYQKLNIKNIKSLLSE